MVSENKKLKIAVVGTGYVGLSSALFLAQHNEVVALDIDQERVARINRKVSTIEDAEVEEFLNSGRLNFTATVDKEHAYAGADFVVIVTPTDDDPETNYFNTSSIELVLRDVLAINPRATMVIKSTVAVGYTARARLELGAENLIFSPEFLREVNCAGNVCRDGVC